MNTLLHIDNIKCGGCAGTIKKTMLTMDGVVDVSVDKELETVSIDHSETFKKQMAIDKLFSLGYPEKGSVSGLTAIGANARSFVSCAVGKFSSDDK